MQNQVTDQIWPGSYSDPTLFLAITKDCDVIDLLSGNNRNRAPRLTKDML